MRIHHGKLKPFVKSRGVERQAQIAEGMARLQAFTEEQLIHILSDVDREARDRALACSLLGLAGSRNALPFLLQIGTKTNDVLLEWEAFSAIGIARSRRLTRPLLKLVRASTSGRKKRAIIFALGLLNDERSRGALLGRLRDRSEDPTVRALAAEALGMLTPRRRTAQALIAALSDEFVQVRYSSLCSLEALQIKDAAPQITRLLEDHTLAEGEATIADRASRALDGFR